MSKDTGFWARRRAAVQQEEAAEVAAREAEELRAREAEFKEKSDAEVLAGLELPDPASMKMGDDFAAFMSPKVPLRLRNQALRTLWRSNPVLACVDGLNDYDDDYLAQALNCGPVKTTYQVGKGLLKHIDALAEQEREKAAPLAAKDAAPEDTEPLMALEAAADVPADSPVEAGAEVAEVEPEEQPVRTSRRMRFVVEDDA